MGKTFIEVSGYSFEKWNISSTFLKLNAITACLENERPAEKNPSLQMGSGSVNLCWGHAGLLIPEAKFDNLIDFYWDLLDINYHGNQTGAMVGNQQQLPHVQLTQIRNWRAEQRNAVLIAAYFSMVEVGGKKIIAFFVLLVVVQEDNYFFLWARNSWGKCSLCVQEWPLS